MSASALVDSSLDDAIRKAVVLGQFDRAVALCFEANRPADAILLASRGGAELWAQAKHKYLSAHGQAFFRDVVPGVLDSDLGRMVDGSRPEDWRQTLALILSYAPPQVRLPSLLSCFNSFVHRIN